jgi:uncharacterized protein YybS (DUF2232 family)
VETTLDKALPLFGACLAAALALFLAAALPFAGALSLLTPLPVAFCYYRSRLPGLALTLTGALLVSLPASGESRALILLFLELATAGLVLGELMRRNLGPEGTLAAGTLGVLLTTTGLFLLHAAILQVSPAALAEAYLKQMTAEVETNLAALGYGAGAEIETALTGLTRLLPAVLALSVAAVVGLNLALARRLLAALGEELPAWPSFRLWRAPEPLVWVLIAAGLLLVISFWPARLVGLNLLALVVVAYFIQGLAIVAFYLERLRVPRPLRLIAYVLLSLQQFLSLGVAVVGLSDLWIDFRRLKQSAAEEAES